MQPHQERVIEEKQQLDEKLEKLRAFIDTSPTFTTLNPDEGARLIRQLEVMTQYSEILSQRIAAFSAES